MRGNKYQKLALRTATGEGFDLPHAALGLCGEAGEFADLVKKCKYHHHELDIDHMVKELGDVLWYVSLGAAVLGVDLETVMTRNIEKLQNRYPEGFDEERSKHRASDDV